MRKRRLILFFTGILLVLFMAVGFSGCDDRKYDVEIEVNCDSATVCFRLGIDEVHLQSRYSGEEKKVEVKYYYFPKHHQLKNNSFVPTGLGPNRFSISIQMEGIGIVDRILERGSYCISITAEGTSNIWNERIVKIYLDVV